MKDSKTDPSSPDAVLNEKKSGKRLTLRQLCLFSCLGALIFVMKIAMAALPNIEPVSLSVILLAAVFGKKAILSVLIYIALELLIFGIGLWNLCYLYVWPLLFCFACLMRKEKSAFVWACAAALYGFGFGALCSLPQLLIGGWPAALAWWQAGLPFDLLHGTGNFMIVLLLFHPVKNMLSVLAKKFNMNDHAT